MGRLVKHTAKGPAKVETTEAPIFVCRCGLSKNEQGLCDGSHKVTQDEQEDKLYIYNQKLQRVEL